MAREHMPPSRLCTKQGRHLSHSQLRSRGLQSHGHSFSMPRSAEQRFLAAGGPTLGRALRQARLICFCSPPGPIPSTPSGTPLTLRAAQPGLSLPFPLLPLTHGDNVAASTSCGHVPASTASALVNSPSDYSGQGIPQNSSDPLSLNLEEPQPTLSTFVCLERPAGSHVRLTIWQQQD